MDARAFARRTRRGVVRREVREAHGGEETFRRRGAPVAKEALRDEKATYVVPDANVVLHQLDVLEHRDVTCAQLDRLVICRAAAEEVRARDRRCYGRLLALIRDPARRILTLHHAPPTPLPRESTHGATDRATRAAAALVKEVCGDCILTTDDADSRRTAKQSHLRALSTLELCAFVAPSLADRVRRNDEDAAPSDRVYAPHLPPPELLKGVAAGTFARGVFRASSAFRGRVGAVRVEGSHCNRAFDGDEVVVERVEEADALDEEEDDVRLNVGEDLGTSSGRVVGILKRRPVEVCGSFEASGRFRPLDRRFPRVIVEKRVKDTDTRVVVKIDGWDASSKFPRGHFVAELGKRGDKATETTCILRELGVAAGPFSARAMGCLPPPDFDVEADALRSSREDLRASVICSIDPPGCRDIDDALSCTFDEGVYKVGVHIADVTRFVASGSALDDEARRRGTSTYLVDRRLDMLPVLLTADLCSLRAHVDRLAFSAFIDVDEDGTILETRYARTVVRSRAALTYEQAQRMIDAQDDSDVGASVRRLCTLARVLRRNRIEKGALALASPEVKFKLDREDQPTDVSSYQLYEANKVVEEFMLLANVCVASTLAERFPALALLRRHPAPPLERFSDFLEHASRKGFQIDASSSKNLADSLDAATDPSDPELNTLLRIAATRCMAPAAYFCCRDEQGEQRRHYGLAAPLYTHFTSPIRRYADVVVHRLLAAAINDKPLPPSYASRDASTQLGRLATDLNRLATNAQRASRRSVALHTLLFFAKKPMDRCEGRVLSVRDGRLDVLLPQFGVEASIKVDGVLKDGGLAWDDVVVRVFDRVVVRVTVAKRDEDADDAVVLGLVEPAPPRSSGEPAAKKRRT
jgi:exosome complex exonuclease DIS3/RRP44